VGLVGRLCSAIKKDNNILQRLQEEDNKKRDIQEKVFTITEDMLRLSKPIWKAQMI
jgi:hypothetical protein